MTEHALRDSVESLRQEIEQLPDGDSANRERLESLIADIENRLENPDDVELHDELIENIQNAVTHFEVEHPTATGVLNHIMVTLGNMGI